MGKSIRSKSKRSFRRLKREKGVFAVADAARVHRLSAKLLKVSTTDRDGDVPVDAAEDEGWCYFAWLGLMDPDEIKADAREVKPLDCILHAANTERRRAWRS